MTPSEYNTQKTVYVRVSRGRFLGIKNLLGTSTHIIDIGCGSGELGTMLKKTNPAIQIFGVDVSNTAVEMARKVLNGAIACDITDAEALRNVFKDVPHDALVVSEVLEHLIEPEKFLAQLRTFSKAPIIISVPNILFWKNRLRMLLGNFTYTETGIMDRGHVHFFSWDSFQDTLAVSGYTIVGTDHHVPTRGTRVLARVFPGLFAYQFIVKVIPKKD